MFTKRSAIPPPLREDGAGRYAPGLLWACAAAFDRGGDCAGALHGVPGAAPVLEPEMADLFCTYSCTSSLFSLHLSASAPIPTRCSALFNSATERPFAFALKSAASAAADAGLEYFSALAASAENMRHRLRMRISSAVHDEPPRFTLTPHLPRLVCAEAWPSALLLPPRGQTVFLFFFLEAHQTTCFSGERWR